MKLNEFGANRFRLPGDCDDCQYFRFTVAESQSRKSQF